MAAAALHREPGDSVSGGLQKMPRPPAREPPRGRRPKVSSGADPTLTFKQNRDAKQVKRRGASLGTLHALLGAVRQEQARCRLPENDGYHASVAPACKLSRTAS
jgi:hypothetical protein